MPKNNKKRSKKEDRKQIAEDRFCLTEIAGEQKNIPQLTKYKQVIKQRGSRHV